MQPKVYNTPKRHCVIKTRLTEAERAAPAPRRATLTRSQSEQLRHATSHSRTTPVIRVSQSSGELLTSVSSLVAQYGKIGSNLNQIARYLNEGSPPYQGLAAELRGAAADLAALKFDVLKVIGEAYGNDKTYQL